MFKVSLSILLSGLVLNGLVVLNACQPKAVESPYARFPEHIKGEWQLVTAYRNEQETKVLDGTFFNFNADQAMETNLPLNGPWSSGNLQATYNLLSDSLIMTAENLSPQTFHITVLDSQFLIMSTLIQNQAFRFNLERKQ